MKVTNGETASEGSREEIANYFSDNRKTNHCPITDILSRISDKWTMHAIIMLGKSETLRFTELKKMIPGISQRMLTVTLRTLEEDGLVTRTIYPQIPPRVEYELTPLGRSLVGQLISLSEWANVNMVHILRAREEYILKRS
jgi:DNA-binding HxlR family transcriptional regulator